MILPSFLFIATTLVASTDAFAPSRSSLHRNTQLHSYLDSLNQPPSTPVVSSGGSYLDSLNGGGVPSSYAQEDSTTTSAPSSFGEMISNGGMTDSCAFNAASLSLSSQLASSGSISASDIHDQIELANKVVGMVRYHFPGSLGSSEILQRVINVLEGLNIPREHILLSQSVCPDEINHEHGDITDLFINNIGGGKVFHLGGLAGVPFTGKTGFGAYSGHVEEDGHCFILQAPHIGMSNELVLGEYSREGQSSAGHACGAAVGAMCHCAAGNPIPDLGSNPDDYQMNFLIQEIGKRMGALSHLEDENVKQAELARQTSDIGREMLSQCIHTNFGSENSMLLVLTGIQINMPFDFEDYFQPLSFELHKKDGSVIDLFNQAFGM